MRINQCKGKTKKGKGCQAAATEGGLCFFHANPSKAVELGRVGGRTNRRRIRPENDALPLLDSAIAVRNTLARLISEVYAGRLNHRIAAGLAPLLNLQLRAIELTNHKQRIEALEQHIDNLEPKDEPDSADEDESAGKEGSV